MEGRRTDRLVWWFLLGLAEGLVRKAGHSALSGAHHCLCLGCPAGLKRSFKRFRRVLEVPGRVRVLAASSLIPWVEFALVTR